MEYDGHHTKQGDLSHQGGDVRQEVCLWWITDWYRILKYHFSSNYYKACGKTHKYGGKNTGQCLFDKVTKCQDIQLGEEEVTKMV